MMYDAAGYGRAVGNEYDLLYPGTPAENDAAAELIAALAAKHSRPSFVEFGIGTGRLALAIADRGVEIGGIDGAAHMLERLRDKGGSRQMALVLGDYRDSLCGEEHSYAVAALVFNGIFDPRGVDAQADIFVNAARHLVPGGYFVVETWVMTDKDRDGSWSVMPRFVAESHVELQLARFDLDTNQIERTLVHLRPEGLTFVSVKDTYASPRELDLLARTAGFERISRQSAWTGEPFSSVSSNCISIYRLVAGT